MRAICFIQEVKSGDLTMRQQILICRKALRKLRWSCDRKCMLRLAPKTSRCRCAPVWPTCCAPRQTAKQMF